MSVSNENHKKRAKQGILRLDIYEPNRSSGGSVEFRNHPEIIRQVNIIETFYVNKKKNDFFLCEEFEIIFKFSNQ